MHPDPFITIYSYAPSAPCSPIYGYILCIAKSRKVQLFSGIVLFMNYKTIIDIAPLFLKNINFFYSGKSSWWGSIDSTLCVAYDVANKQLVTKSCTTTLPYVCHQPSGQYYIISFKLYLSLNIQVYRTAA